MVLLVSGITLRKLPQNDKIYTSKNFKCNALTYTFIGFIPFVTFCIGKFTLTHTASAFSLLMQYILIPIYPLIAFNPSEDSVEQMAKYFNKYISVLTEFTVTVNVSLRSWMQTISQTLL